MNKLTVFNNPEFGEIRTTTINNEPYLLGKDVAEKLGYSNPPKAIRDHVDDEDKLTERIVLAGQNREVIFINESGVYSLILSSKLPNAKKFKHWVTSEVLPSMFGEIRTVVINDEPWLVGKDVATALGYENQNRDIQRHVAEEDRVFLDEKTQYQNGIEFDSKAI